MYYCYKFKKQILDLMILINVSQWIFRKCNRPNGIRSPHYRKI